MKRFSFIQGTYQHSLFVKLRTFCNYQQSNIDNLTGGQGPGVSPAGNFLKKYPDLDQHHICINILFSFGFLTKNLVLYFLSSLTVVRYKVQLSLRIVS